MSESIAVLLGVDTEADDQWSEGPRRDLPVRNVHELPRLQQLCDRHGIRPTYLVTHEMAVKDESRNVLRELASARNCEIAAHHHPWSTPPKVNAHLYPLNLTTAQFREQLAVLTQAVSEISGDPPISYRSGRNGFAGWQVPILEELGYRIDSSVDPFFNEKRKGGPSFAGAPLEPYFVDFSDPCRPGNSELLEIPISSALDRRWPAWLSKVYADVDRAYQFRRVLRLAGIVRPVWLRPSYSQPEDMRRLATRLVERRVPVANIIFHSSELMPGGSPYNQSEADVDRFYDDLEDLLQHLVSLGATGQTFREFRESWLGKVSD